MIACVSSGSSRSEMLVKPATSANRTVISLRAPSRAALSARILSARGAGVYELGDANFVSSELVPSAAPHSRQNFPWGGFASPHRGQTAARAAPHVPQNFAPSGLGVPHTEQVTIIQS